MKARKRVTSQKLHELEALIKEREADAAILPPGRKRPKRPMDAGPRLGERPMIDLPEKLQTLWQKPLSTSRLAASRPNQDNHGYARENRDRRCHRGWQHRSY
jgi:hypothetical protein